MSDPFRKLSSCKPCKVHHWSVWSKPTYMDLDAVHIIVLPPEQEVLAEAFKIPSSIRLPMSHLWSSVHSSSLPQQLKVTDLLDLADHVASFCFYVGELLQVPNTSPDHVYYVFWCSAFWDVLSESTLSRIPYIDTSCPSLYVTNASWRHHHASEQRVYSYWK